MPLSSVPVLLATFPSAPTGRATLSRGSPHLEPRSPDGSNLSNDVGLQSSRTVKSSTSKVLPQPSSCSGVIFFSFYVLTIYFSVSTCQKSTFLSKPPLTSISLFSFRSALPPLSAPASHPAQSVRTLLPTSCPFNIATTFPLCVSRPRIIPSSALTNTPFPRGRPDDLRC